MITLIVGTNRPGSNTQKVARHVEEIYAALKVPLHVLDLAQLPPEIFSPTSYAQKPMSFLPFSDAILKSAGLHVVTPEYNGSVPGVMKYFIDMLKFPESFEKRPVCFTAWGPGFGARSGQSSNCRPFSAIGMPTCFPSASSCQRSMICSMTQAA